MPRDGSGNFSRSVTPPNTGDIASATDYNSEQNDVASALSDSINKSGTKAWAANQPVGGFKFTGLGAGTVNGDSVRYEQLTGLSATYQPLDATLTALAALSWSSLSPVIQFTAADTVSLTSSPSMASPTVTTSLVMNSGATINIASSNWVATHSSGILTVGTGDLRVTTAGTNTASAVTVGGTQTLTAKTLTSPTITGGTSTTRIGLSSEVSGTLTSASANTEIMATGGITLPNAVFAAQDKISIQGNGTARTITRGASVTMYIAGTDSATGTLTANGVMMVHWRTASVCELSGNVS